MKGKTHIRSLPTAWKIPDKPSEAANTRPERMPVDTRAIISGLRGIAAIYEGGETPADFLEYWSQQVRSGDREQAERIYGEISRMVGSHVYDRLKEIPSYRGDIASISKELDKIKELMGKTAIAGAR